MIGSRVGKARVVFYPVHQEERLGRYEEQIRGTGAEDTHMKFKNKHAVQGLKQLWNGQLKVAFMKP